MQERFAWRHIALLITIPLVLSGCLSQETSKSFNGSIENHMVGSVGDGPVAGASMQVLGSDGVVLSEFVSDTYADYDTIVSSGNEAYPLTIEARGGWSSTCSPTAT